MSREEKLLERLRDFRRDEGWDFEELCGLLRRLDTNYATAKACRNP
jgi:hypothetical protein